MFFARGILVLAMLLLVGRTVSAAEPQQPAEVAELFAKMRGHLAPRITSIEYTSGSIEKRYAEGVLKESTEREVAFAYAAGKYRSRLLVKSSQGTAPFRKDHAYDGMRYQELHGDLDLVRSSKPFHSPYGGLQPFFYPYALLFKASAPHTFESYLDEAAWKTVAADAVLEGSKGVDGHACQVVRITFPRMDGGADVRRVHVATDLEHLPVLIE